MVAVPLEVLICVSGLSVNFGLQASVKFTEALSTCKYPTWAINRMKTKTSTPRSNKNNNQDNRPICKSYITVPYNEGLGETFKNICKRYGIEVHFNSGKTIKDELVAPKDKDHITKKSGVIYRYRCDRLECDEEYIGRQLEHLVRGLRNI